MQHRVVKGINLVKLTGNYQERATQHARLLKEQIHNGPLKALAKKNEWLFRNAGGPLDIKTFQNMAVNLYHGKVIRGMEKALMPKYREIMNILSKEAELPYDVVQRAMFQADGLMLMIRLTMFRYMFGDLQPRELPGCSSAAVMGDWTKDGKLLVSRNQDYPIVGPWEENTTVFYHEPSEAGEIPHVSVGSAGLHTSGLTSMNKEGLTVAAHAHFGKEVHVKGQPIFVVGEEIISKAKNLNEAVDIASKIKRNANWTLVVTSAKDNHAIAIEMTPNKTRVRHAEDGFINHTNFFHNDELNKKEALLSAGRHDDDFARLCRMKQIMLKDKGHLTPEHLIKIPGDHHDPWTGEEKIFNNTVSVLSTVKSVVFSPDDQKFWVSNRKESPVGLGDFVELSVSNEDFRKEEKSFGLVPGYKPENPDLIENIRAYREAYIWWHMKSDQPDYKEKAYECLVKCLEQHPQDGNVYLQAGMVAFKLKYFDKAKNHFLQSRSLTLSDKCAHARDLFLARCYDVLGDRARAREIYREGSKLEIPSLAQSFKRGLKRAYRAKQTDSLMLDFQFADPIAY